MKKTVIAGLLCMGLCVSFAGCGNSAVSSETTASDETVTETEETDFSSSDELNSMAYAYDYDLKKIVTLGEYKGLTYTYVDTRVSDEEIDEDIKATLSAYAQVEQIKDGKVKNGDTVNINFTGTIDGKEFEGGTSTDYSLEIGSNYFIEGFEEGLVGHSPGEDVVLDLKFPDDYQAEELAGKDVQFTVKINYIEGEDIIPELNDDFVKELGITDVNTVDKYRKYIKEQMEEERWTQAGQEKHNELVQKAVENATINEYPEALVKQYKDNFTSYYEEYAAYYGVDMEEFLASYGAYFGTSASSLQELEEEAENYAKESTANMLVICAIADAEGFEVTDEIYDKKLTEFVDDYGFEDKKDLEDQYGERYLKQIIINEEAITILEKNAVVEKGPESESETESESESETGE